MKEGWMHWHTIGMQKKSSKKLVWKNIPLFWKPSLKTATVLTYFQFFFLMFRKQINQTHHHFETVRVAELCAEAASAERWSPQWREG